MLGRGRFRHIAIEGAIGAGKSTLARRLAVHLEARLMLERPEDNPFLERYYRDGARFALPTQLCFLFQRLEQMRELSQGGVFSPVVVSDFMFAKDRLFAQLTLDEDEYRLYRQIESRLAPRMAPPDVVLWLQASPQTLVDRIRRRDLEMERVLDVPTLERLSAAYAELLTHDPPAPVLAIDTERFNPAADDSDFNRLVERLDAFRGPFEFFDPSADWAMEAAMPSA